MYRRASSRMLLLGLNSSRRLSSLPAHTVVNMPSLSPTMTSGSIGKWLLAEGDRFEAGQSICEVETDKASVSFDAQDDGFIAKILAPAGAGDIKCGEPIMVTVEDKESVAAFVHYAVTSAAAAPVIETPPPTQPATAPPSSAPVLSSPPVSSPGRVFASPYARKLLREGGRSLAEVVSGSGPGGRVVAADVEAILMTSPKTPSSPTVATRTASPSPPTVAAAPPASVSTLFAEYPLSAVSMANARAAVLAKQTVPHYYLSTDVNVAALIDLREAINKGAGGSSGEGAVSVLALLVKAAAAAMRSVPELNSAWVEGGAAVRRYSEVHVEVIGGAEGAPAVVRDAGGQGVAAIQHMMTSAASGGDNERGTFSVHSLGMFGVKAFAPVIKTPQAGALALGAIIDTVVPSSGDENDWAVAPVMTVTLSCDHRVVDGAVGAAWLGAFKSLVENPVTIML